MDPRKDKYNPELDPFNIKFAYFMYYIENASSSDVSDIPEQKIEEAHIAGSLGDGAKGEFDGVVVDHFKVRTASKGVGGHP